MVNANLIGLNGANFKNMENQSLLKIVKPSLKNAGIDVDDEEKLLKVLDLVKDSFEHLDQIVDLVRPFYENTVQIIDGQAIALYKKDSSQKVYWSFVRYLSQYDILTEEIFRSIMKQIQKDSGILGKELWVPIRVALTGQMHGPELAKVAEILGKVKCERFIMALID